MAKWKRLRDVAADTELTRDQLADSLDDLARQTDIVEYVERARGDDNEVKLLYRHPPNSFVFGVSEREWDSISGAAGFGETEQNAVRLWHSTRGRDLLTTGRGHSVAEHPEDMISFVIQLPPQESWNWVTRELALWFEELAKGGMTPAEMLDYWAVEEQGYTPKDWAEPRGVSAEAVRKNVRQAEEKLLEVNSAV